MRSPLDTSTLLLAAVAVVLAVVAYLKESGLCDARVRHTTDGGGPPVGRPDAGAALLLATLAGVVTPGGPMVTVPFMVVLANSGAALPSLVAYMPSLAFPVIAGWLVSVLNHE